MNQVDKTYMGRLWSHLDLPRCSQEESAPKRGNNPDMLNGTTAVSFTVFKKGFRKNLVHSKSIDFASSLTCSVFPHPELMIDGLPYGYLQSCHQGMGQWSECSIVSARLFQTSSHDVWNRPVWDCRSSLHSTAGLQNLHAIIKSSKSLNLRIRTTSAIHGTTEPKFYQSNSIQIPRYIGTRNDKW